VKIAIYSTTFGADQAEIYSRLFEFFEKHNIEVALSKFIFEQMVGITGIEPNVSCLFGDELKLCPKTDLLLSIGGDGTFLDAISHVHRFDVPVAGINCGRLGFLADINSENIEEALEQFIAGDYTLEHRSMLELVEPTSIFPDYRYALNDISVHKLDNSSMIKIQTSIDGEFLANYWADGLIVSTPTGSTAYSLSVGGPIVMPNLAGIIVTSIASHHLTVRPVVVPDNVEISLEIEGRGNQFMVSIDHRSVPVDFATTLKIRKAKVTVPVLRLKGQSFYSTLRNKLMWAADRRNI
jgi:NAD+ kinase